MVVAYDGGCAVLVGGGVKCWGWNHDGELGNNSTTDSLVPVDVAGLQSGVRSVAVGVFHACALMIDGGVKGWGQNKFGELGNGTTQPSNTPVDVISPWSLARG